MSGQLFTTALYRYIEVDETFYAFYEHYDPDRAIMDAIRHIQPQAFVITSSRYSCPDCSRHVPGMARIAEHLPGWTWSIADDENSQQKITLGITRVPTFIVYSREDGPELGRIIEHPLSGLLERDLLTIVSRARGASNH